jgi:hypothetical protein
MSPFGSGTPVRGNVKPGKCTNGEHKSRTVQKLWKTMRILFPTAQLGDAGEHLLKSLVDNERELVDPLSEGSARAAWASLCTDVLSVCDVDSMRDFWGCGERGRKWDWTNEDKETIWKTCVEKWKKVRGHWEGGVVLLGVPFTCVLSMLKKRKNTDCRPQGCQSMGLQNRRRCPVGRAPRTGDRQGIRLRPGFPDCPQRYHGFHLSQPNAYQWNLLDARGRITYFPSGHCRSARDPRGPRRVRQRHYAVDLSS